jgi:hypothetical protein
MSCLRLESANTVTSKRTLKVCRPVQQVSMSGSEKTSNMKQSAASKSLEQRREYFKEKQG